MGYTPENNPYIPGDPYSYDLKWIVDKIKIWGSSADAAERAEAAAALAVASSFTFNSLFVTPEKFGAVGDGVTDDHDAFLEAITAGLPVQLTQGKTYALSKLNIAQPVTIYGNGATLLRLPTYEALLDISADDVYIENVIIDGNAASDVGNFSGINLTGDRCTLDHIVIKNCRNNEDAKAGIFADGSHNSHFSNLIMHDIDKSALYLSDCDTCLVEKVLAYNNGGSGITSARTSNTVYKEICAHDNGYSCVSINGDNCTATDIIVYNSGFAGLNLGHNTIAGGANNCVCNNIYAYNNTLEGLSIQNSKGVKIYNSIAVNNTRNASRLQYDSEVYYENVIFDTSANGAGILITSGKAYAEKCTFKNLQVGLSVTNSHSGTVNNSIFEDNILYHVVFDNVVRSGIRNCKLTSSADAPLANGCIIATSDYVDVINNDFSGSISNEILWTGSNTHVNKFSDPRLTLAASTSAFALTPGANVTIDAQFCYRSGNILFGSVAVTPSASIAGGVTIASIPIATLGVTVTAGKKVSSMLKWNGNFLGTVGSIQIDASGNISQAVGTMSSGAQSTFIFMINIDN